MVVRVMGLIFKQPLDQDILGLDAKSRITVALRVLLYVRKTVRFSVKRMVSMDRSHGKWFCN